MKRLIQVWLLLLSYAAAFGAATDVQLIQRDGSNRNQYITITGSSNTWEALRFNGSGILGSMTLSEWIAGSPAVNWGIIRRSDSGTQTSYIPSADTNAARGTALINAVAAAEAGDSIFLAPGIYETGTTQLVLPSGVSLIGQGWSTTTILGQKRTNNIKVTGANTIQGIYVVVTTPSSSDGHSIIGNESAAYSGVVIRDCYLQGEQDIFNGWGQYNNTDIRLVDSILVTKFDVFNHTPGTGNTIYIEGCTVLADGAGNPDSSAGLSGLVTTTGVTLNVRNTRIIMGQAAAGGAGPGIVGTGSGVANVQDCWITVDSGGYDLQQTSSSTINVTGGRGSGTNGAYSTSGTITHIGADFARFGSSIDSSEITDGTIAAGDIATGAVTTTGILDGTIAAGDIATGAVTSTGILNGTITTDDIATGGVASTDILDLTIDNGDISATANIELSKLEARVGSTQAGGWAGNAVTTNPYTATWATKQLNLYYGATGEIDLPAVSNYTDASIIIISTGTFTITVDPNGTETIIEDGASLGAGVADSVSTTAGQMFGYHCDGTRWVKFPEQGGGTSDYTELINVPAIIEDIGALTDPGADRIGFWDDSAGTFTWLELGSGLSISTTTLSAPGFTQTGTFNGTGTYNPDTVYSGTMSAAAAVTMSLSAGQWVTYNLDVTGSTRTLSGFTAYRVGYSGGTITTLDLPVGRQRVHFYHDGTNLTVMDSVAEQVAIGTDVSGLGTGVATFLGTPSSANLRSALTDENGTGAAIFSGATNPAFTNVTYTNAAISALDIDWAAAGMHHKTLSANSTFTFSNVANGMAITVALTNTASNYTVTWPTVTWKGGVTPTQTIGAKTDIYTFIRINGVTYGSVIQDF